MIIVTGGMRTGTSWVMQILMGLGITVKGFKYHPEFPDRDLNIYGYWELPLADQDKDYGKDTAIKLFGKQFYDCKYADMAIVCRRNREDALKSIEVFLKRTKSPLMPKNEINIAELHDKNYEFIEKKLDTGIPFININFDDLNKVEKIKKFLNHDTQNSKK